MQLVNNENRASRQFLYKFHINPLKFGSIFIVYTKIGNKLTTIITYQISIIMITLITNITITNFVLLLL